MLHTLQEETSVNRPIAKHGHRKPDRALVIAMVKLRIIELPATCLRRRVLEQMIERVWD